MEIRLVSKLMKAKELNKLCKENKLYDSISLVEFKK